MGLFYSVIKRQLALLSPGVGFCKMYHKKMYNEEDLKLTSSIMSPAPVPSMSGPSQAPSTAFFFQWELSTGTFL